MSAEQNKQRMFIWKNNMIVLLALYPIVFSHFFFWQRKAMAAGIPFWLTLFIANVLTVNLLGWVAIPYLHKVFKWWLYPQNLSTKATLKGVAIIVLCYGICMFVFSQITL